MSIKNLIKVASYYDIKYGFNIHASEIDGTSKSLKESREWKNAIKKYENKFSDYRVRNCFLDTIENISDEDIQSLLNTYKEEDSERRKLGVIDDFVLYLQPAPDTLNVSYREFEAVKETIIDVLSTYFNSVIDVTKDYKIDDKIQELSSLDNYMRTSILIDYADAVKSKKRFYNFEPHELEQILSHFNFNY